MSDSSNKIVKQLKRFNTAFDPMIVRAERNNEIFAREPISTPDRTLRGNMVAGSPWQRMAQSKFDANMKASAPIPEPLTPMEQAELDRQAELAAAQSNYSGPKGL